MPVSVRRSLLHSIYFADPAMAKASQKRIGVLSSFRALGLLYSLIILASQNENAVKNLRLGMLIPTVLHILLRLLFRRSSLPPSKGSLAIYIITFLPIFLLSRYLEKIGTTKRDASGTLISSGEDLSQAGITEWCFDVIYVTCMSYVLKYCFDSDRYSRGMPSGERSVWGESLVLLASGD